MRTFPASRRRRCPRCGSAMPCSKRGARPADAISGSTGLCGCPPGNAPDTCRRPSIRSTPAISASCSRPTIGKGRRVRGLPRGAALARARDRCGRAVRDGRPGERPLAAAARSPRVHRGACRPLSAWRHRAGRSGILPRMCGYPELRQLHRRHHRLPADSRPRHPRHPERHGAQRRRRRVWRRPRYAGGRFRLHARGRARTCGDPRGVPAGAGSGAMGRHRLSVLAGRAAPVRAGR